MTSTRTRSFRQKASIALQSAFLLPASLTTLLLALAWRVEPIATGNQDAAGYLGSMMGFLEHGWRLDLFREPFYPLFLALMFRCGMDPARFAPFVQSALFLWALFFFCTPLFGSRMSFARVWTGCVLIALIPTFLIPLNGAIYSESLSATLVLFFLGALTRLSGVLTEKGKARWIWATAVLLSVVAMNLTKGAFIYVNYAFAVLMIPAALLLRRFGIWNTRRTLLAFLVLAVAAAAGRAAVGIWLGTRPGQPGFTQRLYTRGGSVLFGRVSYAAQFDFVHESFPFFMQALSEKGCRRIVGERCERYGFGAEEGYGKSLSQGRSDEELMSEAFVIILRTPIRQFIYCFYVLSRFIVHHSTTGFARLEIAGGIMHSTPVLVALKAFNVLIYIYIPWMLIRNRKRREELARRARELPDAVWVAGVFSVAYAGALLAVHGFVWNVVRMVYPIAPLFVIWNWLAFVFIRSAPKS